MIKPETVEAVRDRTDIVALIGESVRLVRRGRTWVGCCPFHKEKTPSFHVNKERGRAYCFGCKESVDAIGFLSKTMGLSFVEAVTDLAGRLGIEIEETRTPQERREATAAKDAQNAVFRANEVAAMWFQQNLWNGNVPAGIPAASRMLQRGAAPVGVAGAWAELAARGLAPSSGDQTLIGSTLRAFRLGFAPPFWDHLAKHFSQMGIALSVAEQAGLVAPRQQGPGHYDRFRNRLMFAVVDVQGRVVGFSGRTLPVPDGGDASACKEAAKYVNTPESRVYTKGQHLFGLWQAKSAIRRADAAVLVEGNFDVVSLHAQGFDNFVAPLGTAFTPEQAALLKRFCSRVTIAFDGDTAGVKATHASREPCTTAALSARVAKLPTGSDPDAFVRAKGADGMRRLLEQSVGFVEWLIDEALDPSTFHRLPLQEQLERVRSVGDMLAKEPDVEMQRLARVYADRAASRLGLTSHSAITVGQLRAILLGKQRPNASKSDAPKLAQHDPEWALQEAILGALIDGMNVLDGDVCERAGSELDGDFALAYAALMSTSTTSDVLTEVPPSLRTFVSARLVEPLHDGDDVAAVLRANVGKLRAMRRRVRRDELLQQLDAVVASGDDDEQLRILTELDALGR